MTQAHLIERLSAQDLAALWWDDYGWPGDIGALIIVEGAGLVSRDGRFRIEAVREAIGPRLHLLPRFRQLLYRPRRGLGWPLWVDAPSFELADHVRVFPLPAPGDHAQLLLACEQLRRQRLDPSRPLWEAWFLPGLPQGQVGLFLRMHHAMADGVAGVAAFGALFDLAADAAGPAAQPWTPAPVPSAAELLSDNLRRRTHGLDRALSNLADPIATLRRARRTWPAWRRGLRRAARPPDQPQPADWPGPETGDHRQPPRPCQEHRSRHAAPRSTTSSSPPSPAACASCCSTAANRRGAGAAGDGSGVPARQAGWPRERQPGRVDGRAAADRRARPRCAGCT